MLYGVGVGVGGCPPHGMNVQANALGSECPGSDTSVGGNVIERKNITLGLHLGSVNNMKFKKKVKTLSFQQVKKRS